MLFSQRYHGQDSNPAITREHYLQDQKCVDISIEENMLLDTAVIYLQVAVILTKENMLLDTEAVQVHNSS
jgi:hypothetical protein